MLTSQILKSRTGQHYSLRLANQGAAILPSKVKAEIFFDHNAALQFVNNLEVPLFFWENLAHNNSFFNYHHWLAANPDCNINSYIALMLMRGNIFAYQSESLSQLNESRDIRSFKDALGKGFELQPAANLLVNTNADVKPITNNASAEQILQQLDISAESATKLQKSLNIPASNGSSVDALTTALVNGDVVVIQQAEALKPSAEDGLVEIAEEVVAASSTEVAPAPAAEPEEEKEDEEKICKLAKLTVACNHDGRKQIVTSDTGVIPILNVVASEKAKRGFEKITATIEADGPCDNHTTSSSSIQPSPVKVTKGSLSNTYELACEPVNNPLNVLWLPSIKPKRYKVSANACDRFSNAAVEVNVFPKIKWNASVGYSFGNKEIKRDANFNADTYMDPTLADNAGSDSIINSHTNKAGKFHGKMELYYDENKKDFAAEYKNGIDKALKNLDDVANKVDSFLANLHKGEFFNSGLKLEVFWPNLNITYEAELLEDKKSTEVNSTYSLNVAANPLIGLKGSIDLFPMALKMTQGHPVGAVLAAAVKGVGNDKSFASLKADIQLVLSMNATASVNFKTTGVNGKDDKECKSEQAIAIEFQAEALIGAKGHILIFKFEKNYRAGIKTGFVGKSVIERDEIGYYWYCRLLFNGLTIVLAKYEKLEKNITADHGMDDMYGDMIPDQTEESTSTELVLLKPSPDEEAPNDTETAEGSAQTQANNRRYLIRF